MNKTESHTAFAIHKNFAGKPCDGPTSVFRDYKPRRKSILGWYGVFWLLVIVILIFAGGLHRWFAVYLDYYLAYAWWYIQALF